MQKAAFITGTSRGIGKAIAELLLIKNYLVFGYSRTNTIEHPNFKFCKINLSDLKEIKKISFPKIKSTEVLLINNAARIGKIVPLNQKKSADIIKDYNLNIIAPSILCSKFINAFYNNKKLILNVSSGAANNNIACWSTYCASKSALDQLTNIIAIEQHKKLNVFSVHPGVVNTQMQAKIRNSDPDIFPLLSKFIEYHNNNQLENTQKIAKKFLHVIKNHAKFEEKILYLRDLEIN